MSETKKELRMIAPERETVVRDDQGDGSRWSGYRETRLEVNFQKLIICPHDMATGWDSHCIYGELYNKDDFDWRIDADMVCCVIARYSDGGTFGCQSGLWAVEGIFKKYKEAETYVKNNKEEIRRKHTHYFGGLEGIDIEALPLLRIE